MCEFAGNLIWEGIFCYNDFLIFIHTRTNVCTDNTPFSCASFLLLAVWRQWWTSPSSASTRWHCIEHPQSWSDFVSGIGAMTEPKRKYFVLSSFNTRTLRLFYLSSQKKKELKAWTNINISFFQDLTHGEYLVKARLTRSKATLIKSNQFVDSEF